MMSMYMCGGHSFYGALCACVFQFDKNTLSDVLFSQLSMFTADCLHHPIMPGVETYGSCPLLLL